MEEKRQNTSLNLTKRIVNVFFAGKSSIEKEQITDLEEGDKSLRNLGFNINKDVTIPIKTISFLGQSITIK